MTYLANHNQTAIFKEKSLSPFFKEEQLFLQPVIFITWALIERKLTGERFYGMVLNLSVEGVRLVGNFHLELNEQISLEFPPTLSSKSEHFRAKINRKHTQLAGHPQLLGVSKEQLFYDAHFSDLTPELSKQFNELLTERLEGRALEWLDIFSFMPINQEYQGERRALELTYALERGAPKAFRGFSSGLLTGISLAVALGAGIYFTPKDFTRSQLQQSLKSLLDKSFIVAISSPDTAASTPTLAAPAVPAEPLLELINQEPHRQEPQRPNLAGLKEEVSTKLPPKEVADKRGQPILPSVSPNLGTLEEHRKQLPPPSLASAHPKKLAPAHEGSVSAKSELAETRALALALKAKQLDKQVGLPVGTPPAPKLEARTQDLLSSLVAKNKTPTKVETTPTRPTLEPSTPKTPPVATTEGPTTLQIKGNEKEAILELPLDGAVEQRILYWMGNPPRLVIDIPQRKSLLGYKSYNLTHPLLKQVQIIDRGDKVRFVCETNGQVHPQVVTEPHDQSLRVVIRRP